MATAKSLPELNSQVDSNFPNNTTKLITPTLLRGQQKDFIVSTPYSFFDGVPGSGQNVAAGYLIGKSRIIDFNTQIEYLYDSGTTTAVWTVIASGGNVTGPGPTVVSNNFAVYSGTGGLTIGSPTGASMDGSGNATFLSVRVNGTGGAGHMHFRHQSSAVSGTANSNTIYGLAAASNGFGFVINNAAYASSLIFGATSAQTYTLPDLSGTFALLANAAAFTSLTVGTASSLAGDVIFQNATNSTTQTFRGTNPTNSIVYLLPTTAPTAGQALVSTAPSLGISTLSWSTVSGSGVNTMGAIGSTPNANGATITGTTLNLEPASASFGGVVTTGTQIFAGAKTFSGAMTINPAGSLTTAQLTFSGTTNNWINFGTIGFNPPTLTNRSVGTKIVLYNLLSASTLDCAIGVSTSQTWISSNGNIAFYGNSTISSGQFEYTSTTRGLVLNAAIDAGLTIPQLLISGGTGQLMSFGAGTFNSPAFTTRSNGTKIILYNLLSASTLDCAIGVGSNQTWISSNGTIGFYPNVTTAPVTISSTAITLIAGVNIAFGTTGSGGQIGTTTAQLIGFHGTAGTIQRASAAQAAVATTTATQTTPWGFTTQAQADGIVTLLNEIRTVLVNKGLMKGSA